MSLAQIYRIAAIVPCHNEEMAIGTVVTDLRRAVPGMTVFVYDNASTDATVQRASEAGAVVRHEPMKGKGNVVRRAFADIDADIYLLIDGDDTYDAMAAPRLIQELVDHNVDHVVGVRREVADHGGGVSAYRPNHEMGNKVLNGIVTRIFGDSLGDMLSGYRVFSRRFVKSFPAVSREFEIETELTVHSLATRIPSSTMEIDFKDRAEGSESKLRTYRDGWKILKVITSLFRHERPITFYGLIAAVIGLVSMTMVAPLLVHYAQAHEVPRFPTLFAAGSLIMIAFLCLASGMILDGIRKSRHELSRLTYLRLPAVRMTEAHHHAVPDTEPSLHGLATQIPAQRGVAQAGVDRAREHTSLNVVDEDQLAI